MLDGRRIVGVSEGDSEPERFIPALARLHELGRLPLDRLIRHYPFEEIEQAAADAADGTDDQARAGVRVAAAPRRMHTRPGRAAVPAARPGRLPRGDAALSLRPSRVPPGRG